MTTQPQPHPLLILYSHGRTPPLHPPPDLKFDLRTISNPPKALRAVSDGRSKRLREHLLSDDKFVSKLGDVEERIGEGMGVKMGEWEEERKRKKSVGDEDGGAGWGSGIGTSEEGEVEREKSDQIDGAEIDEEEDRSASVDDADDDMVSHEGPVLRVGCFCALGHHRSVAFVEELARLKWPREWRVEVVHRDIEKKKGWEDCWCRWRWCR
ncbi:hypothetical protein FB567DRAFT_144896 [Paraphoma chrysanthemicola]|uniref:RapZ C-terminal domain-containing protein n=1 Tax=Paraphoma chrysanthemicola TaxID=798071 RepID=A0A8K0VV57_9PLEO|nr:hypothetical protein FB567DRAFT_144896 [Paraphoma chrysanthemicola]